MPGGHSTFFGLLNSFVHIVMYAYYLLAAMGPEIQKYLWWKKYLTTLQMTQFIVVMVHSFQLLISNPCDYSLAFVGVGVLHAVLFLVLFSKFYRRTYTTINLSKVCDLNVWLFHKDCVEFSSARNQRRRIQQILLKQAPQRSKKTGKGINQQIF